MIYIECINFVRGKTMLNKYTLEPFLGSFEESFNKLFILIFITLSTLNASTIYANENYIDEDSLFDEIETIVSATRLKQKITKAPVSVTIIDKEMIEASGALEVHELLRFVPGFFSYSVSGNQYGVTSHFGADDLPSRLEVRIDGRSVHQPLFDTVDWASLGIDVLDIDHIEIVRGTSASVYGSNAFLGAINIITKGSLLQKHHTNIRATGGSIGTKNFSFNHANKVSDVEYLLSLNAKKNTGFKAFEDGPNPIDKNFDSRSSLSVNFQGSYTPNVENNFTFDIGMGTNDVEIPLREDPRGYSNRVVKTNHQQLKWTRGLGKNLSKFTFYHNYFQIRDDSSLGVLSNLLGILPQQVPLIFPGQQDQEVIVDKNKGFSERIDFEFEKQFNSIDKLDVVFGVGLRRDIVKSHYLIGPKAEAQNIYRVFSNADYQVSDKMNINLGFLAEKAESQSTNISPRIALNYQLNKNQTIRASISKGLHAASQAVSKSNAAVRFDDGSLINLFLFSPNELKPETINSYELAYLKRWPETGTQLDVKVFHEDIEDIITRKDIGFTDIDQSVRVNENNGFIKNNGAELQLEHKFVSIPRLGMRLAYAYIDSKVGSQNNDNLFKLRNSIPKHSATLMINKKTKKGYNLSTIFQYQSDRDNSNEGIKRVDFNIGKKIDLSKSKTAKIDLSIQNAFNHYNDFSLRNDQDMRAFVRMQLDL